MFPKIGVTPKSSILIGCSIINHPSLFLETPRLQPANSTNLEDRPPQKKTVFSRVNETNSTDRGVFHPSYPFIRPFLGIRTSLEGAEATWGTQ